ncbi:unnamed protein product, partial [Rotaria sp. Silwood2]
MFPFCIGSSYQSTTLTGYYCAGCIVSARRSKIFELDIIFRPDNEQEQPDYKTFDKIDK